ncbi:MAG TPA: DUF2093 domain-containing protein [Devosia sp.]|nr:DUF2093 domain-containing protein [Devosia sp.]
MNILEPGFSPKQAKIRFMDADYLVISPGTFVPCAITGKPILIEDLKYWSVDRQEAYVDVNAALQAHLKNDSGD